MKTSIDDRYTVFNVKSLRLDQLSPKANASTMASTKYNSRASSKCRRKQSKILDQRFTEMQFFSKNDKTDI